MQIDVDCHARPATTTLVDPDDFSGFKVVVRCAVADPEQVVHLGREDGKGHVFVGREILLALAGSRRNDPVWLGKLETMFTFAEAHGWTDPTGAVRAHIEQQI